jgi:6-phosphogluconolactonase
MSAQPPDIRVLDDPAGALAELLADQARRGGSIVLTGGSDVAEPYERAAALEPDWSKVTLWWGDERCVPPDSELSNYGLAKRSLLDRLAAQPAGVHRIHGELPPADAARELNEQLEGAELDFLLLGLGPDGHCASLFPGSPQLDVADALATSGPAGLEPFVDRVTFTLPALRSARRIVFVATGERKAQAVAAAFGGEISHDVPASLVRLAPARVEVLVDAAAASLLDNS